MGQVQAVWDAQWAQADTAEFEGEAWESSAACTPGRLQGTCPAWLAVARLDAPASVAPTARPQPALPPPAGLPPLPPPDSPIAYSLGIKLRQAAVVLFWIAVLLGAVLPATLRTALWALRAAGPVCTALLAAWLAASLAYCSRPVDVRAGRGLPLAGRESAAPALAAAPRGAVEGKEPAAAPAADAEEYATAEE